MGERASSAGWDGDLLRVALVGRLSAADIDLVSTALDSAGGRRFGVVLDQFLVHGQTHSSFVVSTPVPPRNPSPG